MRAALLIAFVPMMATAQARTAALAGTVRDTLGHPVRLVNVVVDGTDLSAVTDDSGRFHLKEIPAGKKGFVLRRIGYSPVDFETTLEAGRTLVLDIRMTQLTSLAPVTITAEALKRFESTGFGSRRKGGIGSYVGPEKVDSISWRVTSAAMLLRGLRGIDVICGRPSLCAVKSRNGPACLNVFVNGGFREGQLDDNVTLSEVYALEVYEKPVLVPSEFQGKLPMKAGSGLSRYAGCGAIAVWTRGRAAP